MIYFKESELTCKCGCGRSNMSKIFMDQIEHARYVADLICKGEGYDPETAKFIVTSGCRCVFHNKDKGGAINSHHICTDVMDSSAMDIAFNSGVQLYVIVKSLIMAGFNHIGINRAKHFIHVDDINEKFMFVYEE